MNQVGFVVAWTIALLAAALAPGRIPRQAAWIFPAMGLGLLGLFADAQPEWRLLASSLLFLYLVKAACLTLATPPLSLLDRALFATIWPGMDAENLGRREPCPDGEGKRFGRSLTLTLTGLGAVIGVALAYPKIGDYWTGWLGIAAILCTVHFGVSGLLTSLLRLSGRPVKPLFDRPFASQTLSEFWTKRWNLAFVEMDRRLFLPTLVRWIGLRRAVSAVFIVSGLLHEMAISYPVGSGYGGPLAYFAIQFLGLRLERKFRFRGSPWTLAWLFVPLPLLFHDGFRAVLVTPLLIWLHGVIGQWQPVQYVGFLLWTLPAMQLAVLLASYQVPKRLGWDVDLPKLTPFNRKLMWTYGLFIVSTIIAFAVLSFALHHDFLRGSRAATGLACFMTFFWVLRLFFDTFYFKSEDWPEGEIFRFGHAMLNALFAYLALGYGIVTIWSATR